MEYHYFMYGMFDGTDGNRYDICIPSPFVRNSKVEAMKDENFAYRFLAIDSAWPKLVNDCTAESAFRFISQPLGYFLSEEFCFSKDFLFVISQLFHSSVDFTR